VVDGALGFTGGVGIADQWSGHAQDPQHWRDTHFFVEGPVVSQMQAVFLDNWTKATGQVLHGGDFFPPLQSVGNGKAQMFSSSPSGGSESMQLMYLLAIAAAQHAIQLSSAYFVPDALTLKTLIDALKRGVKIQIITPGEHMDAETVRRASRTRWGPLLRPEQKSMSISRPCFTARSWWWTASGFRWAPRILTHDHFDLTTKQI
jgi:cardiolipin synthase